MTDQERRASIRVGLALVLGSLVYVTTATAIGFHGIVAILVGCFAICGVGLVIERRTRGG